MNVTMVVSDHNDLWDGDQAMLSHFENTRGDTVTPITNGDPVPSGTELLLLLPSIGGSSSGGADYSAEDMPVLCLGRGFTVNMGYGTGSTAHGSQETQLRPYGDEHPAHAGFYPSDTTVLSAPASNWRYPAGAPSSIETRWGAVAGENPVVFTIEASSALLDGKTAIDRHAGWYFDGDSNLPDLTADGLTLLDALTDWVSPGSEPSGPDPEDLTVTMDSDTATLTWTAPDMATATDTDIFRRGPYATEGEVDDSPFDPEVDSRITRVPVATLTYDDEDLDEGFYAWQVFPVEVP